MHDKDKNLSQFSSTLKPLFYQYLLAFQLIISDILGRWLINIIRMKKVFLGGTVNNTTWRDEIIPRLKIDYFNPVVKEWTKQAYKRELKERKTCDFCLYVITPKYKGFYSIAEVVDDSNKRPGKTIFCILYEDEDYKFSEFQTKSINAVGKMVKKNGSLLFSSLDEVVEFLNSN